MKKAFVSLIIAGVPLFSLAQEVPALNPNYPGASGSSYNPIPVQLYGSVNILSPHEVKLNAKEQKGVNLANQWKSKPEMPVMGEDGNVLFAFGATLPSVVCAPLYACDVSLQPGEKVTQVDVGDSVRWKVTPAVSGSGKGSVTHLIVKPTDVGLTSNMVVNTDRRTYNIRLVSRKESWMPRISFTYPEDTQAQWDAYARQQEVSHRSTILSTGEKLQNLDFGYRIKGDSPTWKPIRVYSDNEKTYIQFPASVKNSEIPALVVIGADHKEQLVNYRMVNDRFVVDKIFQKAALISGVGKTQARVDIIQEGD